MVKKAVALSLLAIGTFWVPGCGSGGMVGEDAPTYPVSALLQENTQQVILKGKITCRDGERDVTLTVNSFNRNTGVANISIELTNGDTVNQAGIFQEGNRRSILLYTDPNPVNVTYRYKDGNDTKPTTDKLSFRTTPTTLIYSDDPSVAGGINLDSPASSICSLSWTETGTDNDGNQAQVSKTGTVRFTHLETK